MKFKILSIALSVLFLTAIGCKKEGVSLITASLRKKPITNAKLNWVKNINRGQVVTILEKQKDGEWMKIQLADGKTEGWIQKRYIHVGKKIIIEFPGKTVLYDQPDSESKSVSTLPSGTKAIILETKDNWSFVSISWRLKGWVKSGSFAQSSDMKSQKASYEIYISGLGKCSVEASSTLSENGGYSYTVKNLFDRNPATTWQEGENDDGVGEWVELTFPEPISVSVSMINGFVRRDAKFAKYGEGGDLYILNNRVKSLKVEYSGPENSDSSTVSFEDNVREYQDAGVYYGVKTIRFMIDSVYSGKKWRDTPIAEIRLEKVSQ